MKALIAKLNDPTKPLAADNLLGLTFVPVAGEWVAVTLSLAKAQALLPMLGLPVASPFSEAVFRPQREGEPLDATNPLMRVTHAELTSSQQALEYIEANVIDYAAQLMNTLAAMIPDPA